MQRTIVRFGVLLGVGCFVALGTVRCANVNRGIGSACIRNSDCLSGLCEGQQCVAPQTLFDGGDAVDASFDTSTGPSGDAAKDTGTPPKHDSGKPTPDAHVARDAATDGDAAPLDGSHDGATDADATTAADATDHDAAKTDAAHDAGHDAGHVADGATKDGASG